MTSHSKCVSSKLVTASPPKKCFIVQFDAKTFGLLDDANFHLRRWVEFEKLSFHWRFAKSKLKKPFTANLISFQMNFSIILSEVFVSQFFPQQKWWSCTSFNVRLKCAFFNESITALNTIAVSQGVLLWARAPGSYRFTW